ncbi:MAG: hypothetical protein WBW33_22690 [Bryobacteraceae bacterium]
MVETEPNKTTYPDPPAYFHEALEDAERLLKYASEIGLDIDDDIRDHVLTARVAVTAGWDEPTAANLLAALAKLAARLRPVTAESLKACEADARSTVRHDLRVAIWLAAFIVPFSLASFVATAISNTIKQDITTANDLAVTLRAQLGPPPSATGAAPSITPPQTPGAVGAIPDATIISELQQYASVIRTIDARARQLNVLVFFIERDPFAAIRTDPAKVHEKFQLPTGLPNFSVAADERTGVYQDVRYFAQNLVDDVSFFYGAISACVLPALYALLGTCAYLLRSFEQQIANRTFTPSVANSARFLIAAIGGAVVGLFNNFTIGQGASISPLAIAFLVGYAVDVFFTFLEGMLQAFTKGNTTSPPASGGRS